MFILALTSPIGDVAGSTATVGGPAAPAGGILIKGQTQDSVTLSWKPAQAGGSPIAHYVVYRNGAAYTTTTSTSYTDRAASNATVPGYTGPATAYRYAVAAVDASGRTSPPTTQSTFWVYHAGEFSWAGDYSWAATASYTDTKGLPQAGKYDIAVSVTSPWGGFLPYAGNVVPQWDLEGSAFNYLQLDLKPTLSGQVWYVAAFDRIVAGDIENNAHVDVAPYGPAPTAGQWASYRIPLAVLGMGSNVLTASVSGTTLTVSALQSNVVLATGGYISGPGIAPGTYIAAYGTGTGGVGTYTLSSSQNIASTSLQYQRTNIYKISVQDKTGRPTNTFYVDNILFTAN